MTELVHERLLELSDRTGTTYRRVLVYAQRQPAGTWAAWVEFVSSSGDKVLQTERETTQSTLRDVAYWAAGLQPTYFEGALDRAVRRDGGAASRASPTARVGGMVSFCVRSPDPLVAFRLMGTDTLVPGFRRYVHAGGTLIYVRAVEPALMEMPRIYEFLAHFQSEGAAAAIARRLEEGLDRQRGILEIRRTEVPIRRDAIQRALIAAAADGPAEGGR
jgi:hypothetical protein